MPGLGAEPDRGARQRIDAAPICAFNADGTNGAASLPAVVGCGTGPRCPAHTVVSLIVALIAKLPGCGGIAAAAAGSQSPCSSFSILAAVTFLMSLAKN
jgi:uncharacterized membrane protein YtjA (UPF0391 family)